MPGNNRPMAGQGDPAHVAWICAGSNIGDGRAHCDAGFAAIENGGYGVIDARSPYYMTEPVDYREQDWFVNGVIRIRTDLAPLDLLAGLKAIEVAAGRRTGGIRFGPRILDLDIILYDDRVYSSPTLEIPHVRMHERRFVLKPLCDIDPTVVHPGFDVTVATLLDRLGSADQRVVPC